MIVIGFLTDPTGWDRRKKYLDVRIQLNQPEKREEGGLEGVSCSQVTSAQ